VGGGTIVITSPCLTQLRNRNAPRVLLYGLPIKASLYLAGQSTVSIILPGQEIQV